MPFFHRYFSIRYIYAISSAYANFQKCILMWCAILINEMFIEVANISLDGCISESITALDNLLRDFYEGLIAINCCFTILTYRYELEYIIVMHSTSFTHLEQ